MKSTAGAAKMGLFLVLLVLLLLVGLPVAVWLDLTISPRRTSAARRAT